MKLNNSHSLHDYIQKFKRWVRSVSKETGPCKLNINLLASLSESLIVIEYSI